MMITPFEPPKPQNMEHYDHYLKRLADAFAAWANQPLNFTVSGELVDQAAREGRTIRFLIAGPHKTVAEIVDIQHSDIAKLPDAR